MNRYGAETKMYLEKDKEYLSNIWSISGHGDSNTLSNTATFQIICCPIPGHHNVLIAAVNVNHKLKI